MFEKERSFDLDIIQKVKKLLGLEGGFHFLRKFGSKYNR